MKFLSFKKWKKEMTEKAFENELFTDTEKGKVQYTDIGKGMPILYSHASATGCDHGMLAFGNLLEYGFRLITPSRFGYLKNSLELGKTPEEQADVFAALLDSLNIEKTTLIGWSGGGPSALQFAIKHPDRLNALVLYAAGTHKWEEKIKFMERIFMNDFGMWMLYQYTVLSKKSVITQVCKAMGADEKYILEKTELCDLVIEYNNHLSPSGIRNQGTLNDLEVIRNLPRYPVENIKSPVLVIHSESDNELPMSNAEFIMDNVPQAELFKYNYGGHTPQLGQDADLVLNKVKSFLTEHSI